MKVSEQRIFSDLVRDFSSGRTAFAFIAHGGSMAPFILDGDTVLIRPCHSGLRVGDVVLIRAEEHQFLLHRIIKKDADGVVTCGDACLNADEQVPYENILGKAVKMAGRGADLHLFFPSFGFILIQLLRLKRAPLFPRPFRSLIRKVFLRHIHAKG